jgi:hypothetical protein
VRKIGLAQQISELVREQRMRARVYPRQIAKGDMRQSEADECNARLEAAIATLRWLQDNESVIKHRLAD